MLTYQKFIHSDYADNHNLDNTPDPDVMKNCILFLKMAVEPLESLFEDQIIFHSGYRCLELNTALKGVKNSDHMKGQAIDFNVEDKSLEETYQTIIKSDLKYKQVILEGREGHQWIHFAFDTSLPPDKQKMQRLKIPNP